MASPFITSENARELQRLGVEARLARQKLQEERLKLAEESLDFPSRTLSRVRAQIETLLDDLGKERDPQRIDRLASALGRLNEIERQLAGRPMPGSLKPSAKQPRGTPQVEPTPIETPQAVVSDLPPPVPPE